jgi:hypothetical protein
MQKQHRLCRWVGGILDEKVWMPGQNSKKHLPTLTWTLVVGASTPLSSVHQQWFVRGGGGGGMLSPQSTVWRCRFCRVYYPGVGGGVASVHFHR